jgi:CubicO group peptidase (beta-lactamase class C family)
MLIDDGRLDPDRPAPVAEWTDGRSAITLDDLLRMRDGLDFVEEYVEGEGAPTPHVIEMLFGAGASDVAGFAASRPLRHAPGAVWNYSSGTTNIIARILGELLGGREGLERFLRDRLFSAIGMTTAEPVFDDSGTFIGSSYVYSSARDFARFGYLYLNDGLWNGRRIVSVDRVREAAESHAVDPDTGHGYGRHWWLWRNRSHVLAALGYEGQRIIVDPERDLVVVHLGKWVVEHQPRLDELLDRIVLAHS